MAKPNDDKNPASPSTEERAAQIKASADALSAEEKAILLQHLGTALPSPELGTVLAEDETHETVVVRRPKSKRPTGRYVAESRYKFGDVRQMIDHDEKAGVKVPRPVVIQEKQIVMVGTAITSDEDLKAGKPLVLPQTIVDHAISCGALVEEVA